MYDQTKIKKIQKSLLIQGSDKQPSFEKGKEDTKVYIHIKPSLIWKA